MLIEWINTHVIATIVILFVVAIWDLIWKLTAMWKASKRGSKGWFVVLMIFNTVGILPILYHWFTKDNKIEEIKKPIE